MIDIHSHAIFDVDDGAKNIEQSIRMIKAANSVGYTKICFTPHYMEDGYQTSRVELIEKLELLQNFVKKENIPVELSLGEEVYIFPTLAENLDKVICMNDSRYILMELPLIAEVNYVDEVIYELMANGKVPILAHPERYLLTHKNFDYIKSLVKKGVLLQVNINSLSGFYGLEAKRLAIKLLKNHMVSFLASDAHSTIAYLKVNESIRLLKNIIGAEYLKEITQINPSKMLYDEEIEVDMIQKKSKKSFVFGLW